MTREAREVYQLQGTSVQEINRLLARLADRLDQIEGRRGTPEMFANVDMRGNRVTEAGASAGGGDYVSRQEFSPQALAFLESIAGDTVDLSGVTMAAGELAVAGDAVIGGTLTIGIRWRIPAADHADTILHGVLT